jgi:hypothetical protein
LINPLDVTNQFGEETRVKFLSQEVERLQLENNQLTDENERVNFQFEEEQKRLTDLAIKIKDMDIEFCNLDQENDDVIDELYAYHEHI